MGEQTQTLHGHGKVIVRYTIERYADVERDAETNAPTKVVLTWDVVEVSHERVSRRTPIPGKSFIVRETRRTVVTTTTRAAARTEARDRNAQRKASLS